MSAPEPPRKRPTQADVARLAKVSPAVISAVVNGGGGNGVRVGERTAARVREAIRQLGYVPNVAARNLAGGRNDIVGVFTYEALFPLDALSFYHPFLMGIEEAVESLDRHLLLFTGSHRDGRRTIYKNGVNSLQLADGAILVGQHEDRDELAALLREGFPAVFIGRRAFTGGAASYAAAGYAAAAHQLVERVAGLGHRRIARLRSGWDHESILDRDAGFAAAVGTLAGRLDAAETFIAPTPEAVGALVPRLVAQGYTGVIADDCDQANDVCETAAALGLSVPRDLSVASLGDFPGPAAGGRAITTVTTPGREMGATAVRLLVDILDNPADRAPRQVVIDCGFRAGDTLAPPRDL